MSLRLALALSLVPSLVVVQPASAASEPGHDHAHGAAADKQAEKPDLESLPEAERARVKGLEDALERLRKAEKAGAKSLALAAPRKQMDAARKASFERTKALYAAPAFAKARPQTAAAARAVVPKEHASPVIAWLEDACDPAREPAIELRYALCADAWAHEAAEHPGDWRAHELWRDANAAVGQHDTAFLASWMVAELRPNDARTWYRAAHLGMLADAPKEATGAVHRALPLEVDEVFVAGFAESLAKKNALSTAVQLLENAIAKKPRSGRMLAMQALLMAGGGRPDLALRVVERATKTGYEGADLYLAWGHALHQQKKSGEALVKFRAAVAIDPAAKGDVPPELAGKL